MTFNRLFDELVDEINDRVIDEISLKLLHKGSEYLYKFPFPTQPMIFKIHGNDYSGTICANGLKHSFTVNEMKFAKAVMITKVCGCDYGEVEVFPPVENRMVINK